MNNVFTPVRITLDRERTLRVDFNALAEFEELGKRSIMDAGSWKNMSASDLRLMLSLSLKHEDPTMNEKKAGKLLHRGNMEYVLGCVSKAWTTQLSDGQESPSPLEIPLAA